MKVPTNQPNESYLKSCKHLKPKDQAIVKIARRWMSRELNIGRNALARRLVTYDCCHVKYDAITRKLTKWERERIIGQFRENKGGRPFKAKIPPPR